MREFQEFFGVETRKILKLSGTRWLVLQKCVVRLLDNWEVLKHYFYLEVMETKNKTSENILENLNNDSIKAFMLFLKYSLNFFNNFNALYQSREILIHKLSESCEQLIKQMGQNFLVPTVLQKISIDLIESQNFLSVDAIYVGPECENFLKTQSLNFRREIKLKCLDFYVTATSEMLKCLPFDDIFFRNLKFLNPKFALDNDIRNEIPDLTDIATYFGNFNITDLAFEWRILPSMFNDSDKNILGTLEIDESWKRIFEIKNFNGNPMFPNLDKLVTAALSLPHSNAEAERIFSIVTDVKNKKRNQISTKNLSAICKIRSNFEATNINCHTFQVDAEHLKLHNSENLYSSISD